MLNKLFFYRLYFSLIGRVSPRLVIHKAFLLFHTPSCYERSEIEKALLQKAKKFSISFESYEIAGYRWGEASDPKILLVHGWTGVATSMHNVIEKLVSKGYQVISYDAIGHGDSSGGLSTLSEWADCLRFINHSVGEVECIIAHSLGGTTTFVASKLGLETKKIVLIAPFCNPVEIIEKWFGEKLHIPQNVLDKLPQYFWDKQKDGLSRYGKDWRDIFTSHYQVPTLIVYDKDDKEVSPENVGVCCNQWKWTKFVTTEGLGHRRILYDDSVMDEISSFVLSHPR